MLHLTPELFHEIAKDLAKEIVRSTELAYSRLQVPISLAQREEAGAVMTKSIVAILHDALKPFLNTTV